MMIWARFCSWMNAVLRRSRFEHEMDAEVRFHIETLAEELERAGIPHAEARRRARIEFGGVERVKEEGRESRGVRGMESFLQDLRYGARMLRNNPGFTAAAVLTLALGIGANTAIFSVVDAVLLSPLPYADANRLVLVKEVVRNLSAMPMGVSGPDITPVRQFNHVFEGLAGFRVWTYELSGKGQPQRVTADRASADLFRVLGVQPFLGRDFRAEEESAGHPVTVLSYGLWQRRFGGDAAVLGQTVSLDRRPYTIIGIMPQNFVFPLPGMSQGVAADLWVPLALTNDELSDFGDNFSWSVVARLKPGITPAQADADLQVVSRDVLDLYQQWARNQNFALGKLQLGIVSRDLREEVVGPSKLILRVLLGAAGFVLLIACVNVANLLLMRASGRRKEMAVRVAIGAGRLRLLRQFLVEGLLLSILGGGLGLALALWLNDVMVAGLPATIPRFHTIGLSWPALLFGFFLIIAISVVFGAVPAAWSWRKGAKFIADGNGRGHSQDFDQRRFRSTFVVFEVASAVILLVGAGLLARSFQNILNTNPGFRPEHVLTASVDLPVTEYSQDERVNEFYWELMDRLRRLSGIVSAGGSTDLPLLGQWNHAFTVEGHQSSRNGTLNMCYHSVIYGDYLQAMGISLLRGRYFNEHDGPQSTPVLIVSDALARRYWPEQDALGKRIKWGPPESNDPWLTVVGVVSDVNQSSLETSAALHTYQPYKQLGSAPSLRVALRTEGDPVAIAASLRDTVWSLDPELAVGSVRTMEDVISSSTANRRFSLVLIGLFAVLALLLAAVGIYAVLTYSVAQRTREIGVRIALGARRADVFLMVLEQSLRVTVVGLCFGVAGALALTSVLRNLLYEVRATDPFTFLTVLAVLTTVSLLASYFPAHRAVRIDPMVTLRSE